MAEQGSSWKRRRVLFALGGIAGGAAAIGGYGFGGGQRAQPPAGPVAAAGPADLAGLPEVDVCIIGSGPAGTVLGLDLARAGLRTIIIESGTDLNSGDYDPRLEQLQTFRNTGAIDYPVRTTRMRAVGGTSTIWTGRCSRYRPSDFDLNAYTPEANPWPIDYDDIQPYYTRAERTLRVHGGEPSGHAAPREVSLPLAPSGEPSATKRLLERVGVAAMVSPSSRSAYRAGPVRVADGLMPQYTAHANGMLVCGATVTRLRGDASGRITAAEARDLDGNRYAVRAKAYVVATGAIEAARLLLLSRSEAFPEGIGNRYDRVGRCFMEHPNLGYQALVSKPLDILPTMRGQLVRSHQFYDPLKSEGFGGVILVIKQRPVKAFPGLLTQSRLTIHATFEMSPEDGNRVTLSNELSDAFGDPAPELCMGFSERDRRTMERIGLLVNDIYRRMRAQEVEELDLTWSCHHMGTCRMGDDPRHSVIDRDLRVHGTANLYVAGSAGFVTSGAAHPTLLITALSHRLAEHLRQRRLGADTPPPV